MGFVGKLEEIRAQARQRIDDGAVTKDGRVSKMMMARV
jgi:hypothetical protein